jgi:hypothetical protein
MYEEGVVDPAKVTRSGLQNATSIASMILTTECIIVDDSKSFKRIINSLKVTNFKSIEIESIFNFPSITIINHLNLTLDLKFF